MKDEEKRFSFILHPSSLIPPKVRESTHMSKIVAIFSIPELRQKIFITLLFLVVYRIGYQVPLPFIDQYKMLQSMQMPSRERWARYSDSCRCSAAAT